MLIWPDRIQNSSFESDSYAFIWIVRDFTWFLFDSTECVSESMRGGVSVLGPTVVTECYVGLSEYQESTSLLTISLFVCFRSNRTQWTRAYSFTKFLDHTQRRTIVGGTPLDEWSDRRRDLCLTTHNTHNRHPCPRWDSIPQSQQANGRRPTP